jgi:predicted DNA-binding ribbon-helix-helix protein
LQKRSITLAGHKTSLALEPEFWSALEDMARERSLPLAALISQLDAGREGDNLSSAVRVALLEWARAGR